ncbi:hypothetical protein [Candidatus Hodarchaeum mangrovi]
MDFEIQSNIAQCNGCGAPLSQKPIFQFPVKCDYCDLTNYIKRSSFTAENESIVDDELKAESYYLIYQEGQKVLENFPGEYIGDEIGKIRIKMQVGAYAFPLLVVLDDLPARPYIDGPSQLRQILDCELNDLPSMKSWTPNSSSILNVLEEIYKLAEDKIPKALGEVDVSIKKPEFSTVEYEKDPLIKKILTNYDSTVSTKDIIVKFYAQDGEIINLIIKRKKNYPIGLESELLNTYPLIKGPLEDYAKGRIDLLTTLSEIERLLYV